MVPRRFALLLLLLAQCASDEALREQALVEAAEKGDLETAFQLARSYRSGEGLARNSEKGLAWFGKCAEAGHLEAQYLFAEMNRLGEGLEVPAFNVAAQWYRRAALRGHMEAQYQLGVARYHGMGVPKDLMKAVIWLDRAAEGGHDEARLKLAAMYAEGTLQPRQDHQGLLRYHQAAGLGEADFQALLGWMYQQGIGVPRNDDTARTWYAKAAALGHPGARFQLGLIDAVAVAPPPIATGEAEPRPKTAQNGPVAGKKGPRTKAQPNPRSEAEEVARAWAELDRRDAVMCYPMAILFGKGTAIPDSETAVTAWFLDATNAGFPCARRELVRRYQRGFGTDPDPAEALRWLRLAARDDPRARDCLPALELALRQAAAAKH